jgi:hypothetical protein
MRDQAPAGQYGLAVDYLLPDTRLRRRETSFDRNLPELNVRTVEVDFGLPGGEGDPTTWYVPVAFFPKDEVAPSLEVCGADGGRLAIPTKRENMALTRDAIDQLHARDAFTVKDPAGSMELIRDVICLDPFRARIARFLFAEHEPDAMSIQQALGLLEDQFLLWVPIRGEPDSQHHVTVCRHELRRQFPLLERAMRRRIVPVETALGTVRVRVGEPTGLPVFDLTQALDRLLGAFAVRPLEAGLREAEAARFASCHMRYHAPDGFVVRNLRTGLSDATPGGTLEELDPDDEHSVLQGFDQSIGHLHLSRTDNPRLVYLKVTLALRSGVTTLWMLAGVLTAILLWLVLHHHSYGPPKYQNKQIAAAALLVGPAFASAWSLRAEGSELLRTSLAGARVLLLASAALSVGSALALADVMPFGLSRFDAIEAYASLSYLVAVPLIIAWLLSSRPTWRLFRDVLNTPYRNLAFNLLIAVAVLLVGLHGALAVRVAGLMTLVCGFALAMVSANTVAEELISRATLYRSLAGIGSLPVFFAAGGFLGFYADRVSASMARDVCVVAGGLIAIVALIGFVLSDNRHTEENGD